MHNRGTKRTATLVAEAVMATIKDAGSAGAPLDAIFAALQERICNYSQFDALMRALEAAGCIRRTGEVAFYVPWPPARPDTRSTPPRRDRRSPVLRRAGG